MSWVEHVKISARFALGPTTTPREEASCTLSFNPGATTMSVAATRQNLVNDAFSDWATFVGTSGAAITSNTTLTECRLYVIGTDGRSIYDTAISEGSPVSGSAGSNPHPWQVSNVVTLEAGSRGKGRFGRIYLPPQGFPINPAESTIATTAFNDMFTAVQTLLTNLSNRVGLDVGWKLCVAGQTGTGTLREVTRVRMGHVPDTQRRRRRSLDEAYSAVDFDA